MAGYVIALLSLLLNAGLLWTLRDVRRQRDAALAAAATSRELLRQLWDAAHRAQEGS